MLKKKKSADGWRYFYWKNSENLLGALTKLRSNFISCGRILTVIRFSSTPVIDYSRGLPTFANNNSWILSIINSVSKRHDTNYDACNYFTWNEHEHVIVNLKILIKAKRHLINCFKLNMATNLSINICSWISLFL